MPKTPQLKSIFRRVRNVLVAGLALGGVLLGVYAGVSLAGQQAGLTQVALDRPVDYNWDVKPILSDNCFVCHGPGEQQAGLRLDDPEVAMRVIVPGSPETSELVRRINSDNQFERMPASGSNKELTPDEIATLEQWIAEGAEYKPHWAFIAPERPPLPLVRSSNRTENEVDRFVVARLAQSGLSPSAEADPETLINRVSLTLTGLPPTLDEVDAFVADRSPDAYERLVDRLLASQAYGENMGRQWLDVARYADTDGFLDDHHNRFLWPWRDWVISAFNRNMPFDQFSKWQLAGDLLAHGTTPDTRPEGIEREQTLATTFLRVNKRSTENGAINEEYRVEYTLDRAETIGTAFLGLTVGCARCHDHKYDPITQQDYYELVGFFNSVDEPGFYGAGHSGVQAGPTLMWTDEQTDRQIVEAEAEIEEAEAFYAEAARLARDGVRAQVESLVRVNREWWEALLDAPVSTREQLAERLGGSIAEATAAYYSFDRVLPFSVEEMPEGRPREQAPISLVFDPLPDEADASPEVDEAPAPEPPAPEEPPPGFPPGPRLPMNMTPELVTFLPNEIETETNTLAMVEDPILRTGVSGTALFFNDTNRGVFGRDIGFYDRTDEFALDFWLLAAREYEDSLVIDNRDDDNSGSSGYELHLVNNHLQLRLMYSWPFNMLEIVSREPVPIDEWTHVTITYDGSSRAEGIGLYVNGDLADVDVTKDHLTRTILPKSYGAVLDPYVGLVVGKRFRETGLVGGGALDELRVFDRELTPLEVGFLHDRESALGMDSEALTESVTEWAVALDADVVEAKDQLHEAREAQNQIVSLVPEVLVMGDTARPRQTYILDRGLYNQRRDPVDPEVPDRVFRWDETLPRNRIGLAEWLFDPEHPLTARVFVNRVWTTHFGRGLVNTPQDFGSQGAVPTHPGLLDWLSVEFMESGWDVKALNKKTVMSATYRQTSDSSDASLENDPENRLLSRGMRQRMPAEMVRDNVLAISGLLVPTIGGPSTKPYQPEGIWEAAGAFNRYPEADAVPAEEHHRRSMYTFVKRNAPHPSMAVFDFADRNHSNVGRNVSNTPLQALTLWNDPQYIEAYRVLASGVMGDVEDTDDRLELLFRLSVRRPPTADELSMLREYYQRELDRFEAEPENADVLVQIGVTAVDPDRNVLELAALTNVTTVVMNTPDAYSIR